MEALFQLTTVWTVSAIIIHFPTHLISYPLLQSPCMTSKLTQPRTYFSSLSPPKPTVFLPFQWSSAPNGPIPRGFKSASPSWPKTARILRSATTRSIPETCLIAIMENKFKSSFLSEAPSSQARPSRPTSSSTDLRSPPFPLVPPVLLTNSKFLLLPQM